MDSGGLLLKVKVVLVHVNKIEQKEKKYEIDRVIRAQGP
jgi:hypothetical protein